MRNDKNTESKKKRKRNYHCGKIQMQQNNSEIENTMECKMTMIMRKQHEKENVKANNRVNLKRTLVGHNKNQRNLMV